MRKKYQYGVFTYSSHVFVERLTIEEIKVLDKVGIGSMRTRFYDEKPQAYQEAQLLIRRDLEALQEKLARLEAEYKVPKDYRNPFQRQAEKMRSRSESAHKVARKAKVKSAKPKKGRKR